MIFTYILIIATALYGLFITLKIRSEKRKPTPMVCPLGAHCDVVVKSKFSSFLGIGLESFGALYYLSTVVAYAIYVIAYASNYPIPVWYTFIVFGMSICAFLFSIYLTFVQAFYLKSWCTWCICSACATTLIFLFSSYALAISGVSLIPVFEIFHKPILMIHLLGFALGVGGATITDVLFYRFLSDFKISKEEDGILRIMSQVIWVGLFLAILSGIGLYLPEMATLNESSKFLVKVVIVFVITLNGAILNLLIAPRLVDMSFKSTESLGNTLQVTKMLKLRKTAFALGAISLVSWYSVFALGVMDHTSMPFLTILNYYILLVVLAVLVSQIVEKVYSKKK